MVDWLIAMSKVFEYCIFKIVYLWSTRTDLAHGNVKCGLGLSEAGRDMHAVDVAANDDHEDGDHVDDVYVDDDDNCHL